MTVTRIGLADKHRALEVLAEYFGLVKDRVELESDPRPLAAREQLEPSTICRKLILSGDRRRSDAGSGRHSDHGRAPPTPVELAPVCCTHRKAFRISGLTEHDFHRSVTLYVRISAELEIQAAHVRASQDV